MFPEWHHPPRPEGLREWAIFIPIVLGYYLLLIAFFVIGLALMAAAAGPFILIALILLGVLDADDISGD